jgi:hypothetical protein
LSCADSTLLLLLLLLLLPPFDPPLFHLCALPRSLLLPLRLHAAVADAASAGAASSAEPLVAAQATLAAARSFLALLG